MIDDNTTDLAVACKAATTAIVNLALARIGNDTVVADIAAATTVREAVLAKQFYAQAVNQALAAFDWPWATKYAELVLVGGTDTVPVNADWQYSYRGPVDCVKARRIVGQAAQRRGFDPDPIQFRLGRDDVGYLIYCNEKATVAVPLVLEYTARVACPAAEGDAIFHSVLAWKLAAVLAMPLSHDPKLGDWCEANYQAELRHAGVVTANQQQQAPGGDADWIRARG